MSVMVDIAVAPRLIERHSARTLANVKRGLRSASRRAHAILVPRTPRDRGGAAAGWRGAAHNGEGNVVAYLLNTCPYIGILESGARPHKVSWEGIYSLYLWIERHFRLTRGGALVAGAVGTRLTAGKSTAFRRSQTAAIGYGMGGELVSKAGRYVEKAILFTHWEMYNKLVPAALNITGAIVNKLRTKGQKPRYFVKNALPEIAAGAREEVERCLRESNRGQS